MLTQSVIVWSAAGLMGGTGLYCLARLRRTPHAAVCGDPLSFASEALMGLGAALMTLQGAWGTHTPPVLWAAVYGAATLSSLSVMAFVPGRLHAGPRSRRLHDAIGHLSMVYMGLAMSGSAAHSMADPQLTTTHPGGIPLITGVLLAYFGGHAIWTGHQIVSPSPGPQERQHDQVLNQLRAARASSSAMSLGMLVTLLVM